MEREAASVAAVQGRRRSKFHRKDPSRPRLFQRPLATASIRRIACSTAISGAEARYVKDRDAGTWAGGEEGSERADQFECSDSGGLGPGMRPEPGWGEVSWEWRNKGGGR